MVVPRAIVRCFQRPITWILLSILFLAADYLLGPHMMIPALYIIPICLAAWHGGLKWAMPIAVGMATVRLCFMLVWGSPSTPLESAVTFVNRSLVLFFVAYLVARTAKQTRELRRKVKMLEGILPICSFCKKIRDVDSRWQRLEEYITSQSEASFTHGICPECAQLHYKEHFDNDAK